MTMKNGFRFFISFLLAVSLCACQSAGFGAADDEGRSGGTAAGNSAQGSTDAGGSSRGGSRPGGFERVSLSDDFISGMAGFSVRLLGQTAANQGEDDNVVISPLSAAAALAMAEAGASGDTLSEMEDVLGGGMPAEDFRSGLIGFINNCGCAEDIDFTSVQSVWLNSPDDSVLLDEFRRISGEEFGAEINAAPFDKKTADKINAWVEKNTDGEITKLLDRVPDVARMYLVDATRFKAAWQEPYSDYQIEENKRFTSASGEKRRVTMLSASQPYYVELKDGIGFGQPYEGMDFDFIAILPPRNMSAAEYLASFSGKELIDAYDDRNYDKIVRSGMPEISFDFSASLNDPLQAMGMKTAFGSDARFDRILDGDSSLYISQVLQNAVFSLDRNGTSASAATAVEMLDTAARPEEKEIISITLDRPYIFEIVDTSSGLPIFMGVVNDVPAM